MIEIHHWNPGKQKYQCHECPGGMKFDCEDYKPTSEEDRTCVNFNPTGSLLRLLVDGLGEIERKAR